MRRRGGRSRERDDRDERDQDTPPPFASCELPPSAARAKSAIAPRTTPTAPTTRAMTVSVEVPPPPSEAFTSIVGAGLSDDSEPFQSTIDPSE